MTSRPIGVAQLNGIPLAGPALCFPDETTSIRSCISRASQSLEALEAIRQIRSYAVSRTAYRSVAALSSISLETHMLCPRCNEELLPEASLCRFCGTYVAQP